MSSRTRLLLAMVMLAGGLLWSTYHFRAPVSLPTRQVRPPVPSGFHQTYSTNFAAVENPISEGGKWLGGKTIGLDWSDVATLPGLAHGTEYGAGAGDKAFGMESPMEMSSKQRSSTM